MYPRKTYAHRLHTCTFYTNTHTHKPSVGAAATERLAFHAAMIDAILTNSLNVWLSSLIGNSPLMVNYMLWSGFVPSAWYFTYCNCAEYSQGLSSAAELEHCWPALGVFFFTCTGCLCLRLRRCFDFKLHPEILNAVKCATFNKQCLGSRAGSWMRESSLWTQKIKFTITKSIP